MDEPILLARLERLENGSFEIRSPAVGWWSRHPHAGALLGAGSTIGYLDYQNRRFALTLPDGAAGRLTGEVPSDRSLAVEFGQVLFVLAPVGTEEAVVLGESPRGRSRGEGLPEGTHAVVAPTDGVFYARPAPDAKPFVSLGQRIETGQPVGLVEVMKTFNQIQYGGPGLPPTAEVLEIRAADGAEIRSGEILVVVR